jgi:hypothetical protein
MHHAAQRSAAANVSYLQRLARFSPINVCEVKNPPAPHGVRRVFVRSGARKTSFYAPPSPPLSAQTKTQTNVLPLSRCYATALPTATVVPAPSSRQFRWPPSLAPRFHPLRAQRQPPDTVADSSDRRPSRDGSARPVWSAPGASSGR